jgi:hypothetical protein
VLINPRAESSLQQSQTSARGVRCAHARRCRIACFDEGADHPFVRDVHLGAPDLERFLRRLDASS